MGKNQQLSRESSTQNKVFILFIAIAVIALVLVVGSLNANDAKQSVEENTTSIENTDAQAPDPKSNAQGRQTVGVDEAWVSLKLMNSYINYLGQDISLPSDSVKVSLKDGLKFLAFPDAGYDNVEVTYTFNETSAILSPDPDGYYHIDDSMVTSALTIIVQSEKAHAPTKSERTVLTYDTVIK